MTGFFETFLRFLLKFYSTDLSVLRLSKYYCLGSSVTFTYTVITKNIFFRRANASKKGLCLLLPDLGFHRKCAPKENRPASGTLPEPRARGGHCVYIGSHPNKYYYEIEPCIRRPDKQWSRLLLLLLLLNYWCHPFRIHKMYMYVYRHIMLYETSARAAATRPGAVRFIDARLSYYFALFVLILAFCVRIHIHIHTLYANTRIQSQ